MYEERYEEAKLIYKKYGIDTDKALEKMRDVHLSIQCWQGDDVKGFEKRDAISGGGIQATGNYPGRARNICELRQDIEFALKNIPGKHKVNLHASYMDSDVFVPRNKIEPKHYASWVEWAKGLNIGLDFNPTLFGYDQIKDNLTLSSPDKAIRDYWIEHCIRSRKIGEYFGKELGIPCLTNLWIADGMKDDPSDRIGPRQRLKESLDIIYSQKMDQKYIIDSVESKVFGIGLESYTVGSFEFYLSYALKNNITCLLDNGHFHPTENVSDKISSLLLFSDKIAFHVTRGVRWDSDHSVKLNDELQSICDEIVRCDAISKSYIGLDYFDASINRVASWIIGARNVLKSFLIALLKPNKELKELQDNGDFTKLFALSETVKELPFSDVWNYYCEKNNVKAEFDWYEDLKQYENDIQKHRI